MRRRAEADQRGGCGVSPEESGQGRSPRLLIARRVDDGNLVRDGAGQPLAPQAGQTALPRLGDHGDAGVAATREARAHLPGSAGVVRGDDAMVEGMVAGRVGHVEGHEGPGKQRRQGETLRLLGVPGPYRARRPRTQNVNRPHRVRPPALPVGHEHHREAVLPRCFHQRADNTRRAALQVAVEHEARGGAQTRRTAWLITHLVRRGPDPGPGLRGDAHPWPGLDHRGSRRHGHACSLGHVTKTSRGHGRLLEALGYGGGLVLGGCLAEPMEAFPAAGPIVRGRLR